MMELIRTDSGNADFSQLVKYLDAYLAEMDGPDHLFYAQFNKTAKLKCVVMVYENERAVACGAMREYNSLTMEIKRMYTLPQSRGKGIATRVLEQLEIWAAELNYSKCILETGKRQTEAIELYKKNGYKSIPNFGQYADVGNSLCFEKMIRQ